MADYINGLIDSQAAAGADAIAHSSACVAQEWDQSSLDVVLPFSLNAGVCIAGAEGEVR